MKQSVLSARGTSHLLLLCLGEASNGVICRPSIAGLKKQWCPEIVELMEHMWEQDPADRPTMSEVVQELERIIKIYR